MPITTLLVIEDNPGDARLLREMFEEGVSRESTMVQVDSMADAELHLASNAVDVILLDLGLPDSQGLDAVQRAHAAAPTVPLVIVTGLDDETIATQALQIGAQDYLLKGQIDSRSLSRALRYAMERHALDTAVFTEKERAQVTLNSIADAVVSTDPSGCVTYLNLVASELTGWTFSDAAGQPVSAVLSLHDETTRQSVAFGPRGTERGQEIRLIPAGAVVVRRDGRDVGIEGSIAPIHDRLDRASGTVIVFRDVTDRRVAERDMRRSEERFRRLFDSNTIGITIADMAGRVHEANDAILSMLGFSREDLDEHRIAWETLTPPEFVDRNREALDELRATGMAVTWEKEYFHRDGHRVPVLIGAAVLEASEETCMTYVVDLTSRRHLEDQLRQAQKMEAVGQLAGGVAHDFNNLLTVILGHANMLVHDLDAGDPLLESAEEIRDAGDRAAAMTGQLLAFSRRLVLAPALLNLRDVVSNVDRLLRRMIGEDVVLEMVLADEIGVVLADAGQIEQVLMNLAVNARDAMPEGGTLRITVGAETVLPGHETDVHGLAAGDYMTIAVEDSGTGMTPETQAHMFEPFFTTKPLDRGTGLGLATAYGIVRQSGGRISVRSVVGEGSTFTIHLPRLTAAAADAPRRAIPPGAARATETVLLVEDDASVRRLIDRMLAARGYHVIEAENGAAALVAAAGHDGPIEVLLTDVIMPGMSGLELAIQLVAERPATRVLYMSAYADDAVLRQDVGQVVFLQKPFTADTLHAKLRQAIA
jgi:two-component system cell cycle sensor histidine kinase/response regulator CckA